MAPPTRSRRRALGRFRRPVWRDPAFWAAVAITAVVFGLQLAIAGIPDTPVAWVGQGLRLIVFWIVISALIRIRVGMERGLVAGFTEAERADQDGRASTGAKAEGVARASGRIAGKAVRAYRKR